LTDKRGEGAGHKPVVLLRTRRAVDEDEEESDKQLAFLESAVQE
jgi:hypothetical protein